MSWYARASGTICGVQQESVVSVKERAETLMTIPQAAKYLGRDPSTIRNAVDRRTLPHARIGTADRRGGIIVVDRGDVDAYATRNRIKTS